MCRYASEADEVWHAGDIGSEEVMEELYRYSPIIKAVYGNIDTSHIRSQWPKDTVFELEGLKVWMTHIGGYPGKYPAHIRKQLTELKPGLFICGHSHILKVMFDHTHHCLCVNPGAAGIHGFHAIRTALRFCVHEGKVLHMEVIEFGKRASML